MIILFDLDGTLIDSTEAILESFHHSFDVHHIAHPSDAEIKALVGHPLEVMYAKLGVKQEMIEAIVATYKEHYREISTQKTVLLENAEKAVKLASSFAQLGIVTTKTGKYSQVLMEHFGLIEYFDVLIGREDVTHPKPNAEPILKALESFERSDKDIWMIGDTKMDLLAAKNAGIDSIGVLSGYGAKSSLESYTNIILHDAFEAVSYLNGVK